MSDRVTIKQVRAELIVQLKLMTRGDWSKMLSATEPPVDQTTAPARIKFARVIGVVCVIGALALITWTYDGGWAGNIAGIAIVLILVSLLVILWPAMGEALPKGMSIIKALKSVASNNSSKEEDADEEAKE